MTNSSRPSTSCQMLRPSLTDDDDDNHANNNKCDKHFLSRSLTFDSEPIKQKRTKRPNRPSPAIVDQQPQRLGRSLLSNDNWRHETMTDVRVNAKVIEQSDQNLLFGKGKTFRLQINKYKYLIQVLILYHMYVKYLMN